MKNLWLTYKKIKKGEALTGYANANGSMAED
jgi:hypothetical protein